MSPQLLSRGEKKNRRLPIKGFYPHITEKDSLTRLNIYGHWISASQPVRGKRGMMPACLALSAALKYDWLILYLFVWVWVASLCCALNQILWGGGVLRGTGGGRGESSISYFVIGKRAHFNNQATHINVSSLPTHFSAHFIPLFELRLFYLYSP